MSKGSAPRPLSVTQSEYDSRWDAIFGRDLDPPKQPIEDVPVPEQPIRSDPATEFGYIDTDIRNLKA